MVDFKNDNNIKNHEICGVNFQISVLEIKELSLGGYPRDKILDLSTLRSEVVLVIPFSTQKRKNRVPP